MNAVSDLSTERLLRIIREVFGDAGRGEHGNDRRGDGRGAGLPDGVAAGVVPLARSREPYTVSPTLYADVGKPFPDDDWPDSPPDLITQMGAGEW